MQEAVKAPRGAVDEVAALHEDGAESAQGGVAHHTGASRAAADHEDVCLERTHRRLLSMPPRRDDAGAARRAPLVNLVVLALYAPWCWSSSWPSAKSPLSSGRSG